MSKLPGVKVKTLKIKVEGVEYSCEIRMRENGRTPQFAGFCREPALVGPWLGSPADAQAAFQVLLRNETTTHAEHWLMVTIQGLSGQQPHDDPTTGRLQVSFVKVLRADIGTPSERYKTQESTHSAWQKGTPHTGDDLQHRQTDEFPPPQVDTRTFLIRETPDTHLQIRRLIAKLEEVWYAWLALTEGPDIDLEELIDRGQLTAHARPECRWDVQTGNYPEEP